MSIEARPTCAVCQRILTPGEKFALRGQYVVHRRGDCLVGVPAIERDLEQSMRQTNLMSNELAAERTSHNRSRRRHSDEAAEQQATISDLTTKLLAERHEKTTLSSEVFSLRRSLESTTNELRVLQLRDAMARPVIAVQAEPTPSPEQPISADDSDGTAVRFSLLELD